MISFSIKDLFIICFVTIKILHINMVNKSFIEYDNAAIKYIINNSRCLF